MSLQADERRPEISVSRPALAAALYLAVITGLIYGIWNPGIGAGSDLVGILGLVFLVLLHLCTGAVARSMWVVPLPLAAAVLAIPAGTPSSVGGEPFPIWWGLAVIVALPGAALIAAGIVAARFWTERAR